MKISKPVSRLFFQVILWITAVLPASALAATTVTSGTTELAGTGGTSSGYYEWIIDGDFNSTDFTIGASGKDYNRLTIDDGQTFTASGTIVVGSHWGHYNALLVNSGATVRAETLKVGNSSTMYSSHYNRVDVQGLVEISGTLDVGNSGNRLNSYLSIFGQGVVKTDEFRLYSHWSYGNSWLELNGGILAINGDQTASFTQDQGILASIKLWDETQQAYMRVATYNSQYTVETTSYFDLLEVEYVSDQSMATQLGLSSDLVGYTIIRGTVPLPTSMTLLGMGILGILGVRRRK